jgi:hypothetical protein
MLDPGLTKFIASKDQEIDKLVHELESEKKAALMHANTHRCTVPSPSMLIFGLCTTECNPQPTAPTEIPGKKKSKRDSLQAQLGFRNKPYAYRNFTVHHFRFALILRTG